MHSISTAAPSHAERRPPYDPAVDKHVVSDGSMHSVGECSREACGMLPRLIGDDA